MNRSVPSQPLSVRGLERPITIHSVPSVKICVIVQELGADGAADIPVVVGLCRSDYGTAFGRNTVFLTIEIIGELKFLFFFDFVTMAKMASAIFVMPTL